MGVARNHRASGVQRLVADLNRLYGSEAALHEVDFEWQGFEWIDCNDADASVLSFVRRAPTPDDFVVVSAISRQWCARIIALACLCVASTARSLIPILLITKAPMLGISADFIRIRWAGITSRFL